MKQAPLFERRVRVGLIAPTSAYHGHEGTVDAHELHAAQRPQARKHPHALTIHLDEPGPSTLAYADELVVVGSTPRGRRTDNEDSRSSEVQS